MLGHVELNGQPGALAFGADGELIGAMVLDNAGGQSQALPSVVNPDKLRHLV